MSGSDDQSVTPRESNSTVKRELEPAIRRREQSATRQHDETPTDEAGRQTSRQYEPQPLTPEPIDIENAVFVLLGVALTGGFLVAVVAGL